MSKAPPWLDSAICECGVRVSDMDGSMATWTSLGYCFNCQRSLTCVASVGERTTYTLWVSDNAVVTDAELKTGVPAEFAPITNERIGAVR